MIKSGVCPYCNGPFHLYIGCINNCNEMRIHENMISEVANAEVSEADEPYFNKD